MHPTGKTTLLDMIAGKLAPHSGLREVGETTRIGYLQQDIVDMPGHLTLLSYLKCALQLLAIPSLDQIASTP